MTTSPTTPQLLRPSPSLEATYRAYVAAFDAAGESAVLGNHIRPGDDFGAFVSLLREQEAGRGLPAAWVPSSLYWCLADGVLVGHIHMRHRLTDALRDFGGHVGYAVHPAHRGRGHATAMLRSMVRIARDRGLTRLLLTCDPQTVASATVIEKCGGVLESESWSMRVDRLVRRYWIELA